MKMKGDPIITPRLSSSPELSYAVGVIHGDGHICRSLRRNRKTSRRNWILLHTIDKPFAESFASALKKLGLHPYTDKVIFHDGRRKDQYRVRAISKAFCNWWDEYKISFLGNTDIVPFLKGFYESEGSCKQYWQGYWRITITNTNHTLIKNVLRMLKKLRFNATLGTYKYINAGVSKFVYRIRLSRQKEVQRFIQTINPCIKRGWS